MTLPNFALIGPAGTGKNAIADILVTDYGYEQHAFADSLRLFVEEIDNRYGSSIRHYGYEDAKYVDPYVRERLIEVGVAARTFIHPDVWVYSLLDRLPPSGPVVVTDVRFENELDALVDEGFEFIEVCRPGYVYSGVPFDLPVPPSGYRIVNDGDMLDLLDKVNATMCTAAAFDTNSRVRA